MNIKAMQIMYTECKHQCSSEVILDKLRLTLSDNRCGKVNT